MTKLFKKHKLKEILVVDLELTCWEQKNDLFREIIEIGVVKINNVDKTISDKKQYLIQNKISEISSYCTELTGIDQLLLDEQGVTFEKACKDIKERFGSLNKTWFGWGCGDYNAMIKNTIEKKCPMPFSDNYINLSELYALQQGINRSKSLKKAMNNYNIDFKGRHHSGIVDAVATAELYLAFFRNN